MTKSGLFIPRTLLSRLRELTSQAKRPTPGPTLAGARANSDATVIKCGDSPRASLEVIRALAVKNLRVRSSHWFSCSRGGVCRREPAHPLGVAFEPPIARRRVPAGQARPARRRGVLQRPFSSSAGCWQPDKTLLLSAIFRGGAPAHPLGVAPEIRADC